MEIDFEHRPAAHCENGVTRNLLKFYGYDYSEPLIFGLSASLYFVHIPFIKLAGFPLTSFRPLPGAIFSRVTRLLGFKTSTEIFLNRENAVKKLDALISSGIPAGCVAGMYYLPYMPVEYRFHFNAHNICVIGKEDDNYLISDPVAMEKVTISAKDLLRARFAKGVYPPMGKLYRIKSLPEQTPDMPFLIKKAILKNCYRMLYQPGVVPFVGINTFNYLGDRIKEFPRIYGDRKAALHLAQLVRMMEEIGTGGAGFRFLYAAFLQEAADVAKLSDLCFYSHEMTETGDMWREFAANAARIYKNRAEKCIDYRTVGEQLINIGLREKMLFTALDSFIKNKCRTTPQSR
ncbi:MAG: BtrH N-terminal domain-containing protein [Tannerella sp.]|jgi:hypothetical protein|nr:BtrH N-terminal domain-containing protein [Tannerella sp.]